MRRAIELSLSPFVHSGFAMVFLAYLLNYADFIVICALFVLMLAVHTALTAMTARGRGYVMMTNLLLFLLFQLIMFAGRHALTSPNEAEEDYGAGILLLVVGFPLSLASLLIGSFAGVMLSIVLRRSIARIRRRFYRKLACRTLY